MFPLNELERIWDSLRVNLRLVLRRDSRIDLNALRNRHKAEYKPSQNRNCYKEIDKSTEESNMQYSDPWTINRDNEPMVHLWRAIERN
mmetsp:Transcript_14947/g.22992  ORF Transcript_14947/g.22992 Transcript_14947/m.22992 type:complete len:88 (+) Transcript_14947:426-689(+)